MANRTTGGKGFLANLDAQNAGGPPDSPAGRRPPSVEPMADLLTFLALLWLASAAVWILAGLGLGITTVAGRGRRGDGA